MASALVGQVIVIGCTVVIPMIWTSTIPDVIAKSSILAAPGPPAPPPPPAAPAPVPRTSPPLRKFDNTISAPREVPKTPPRVIIDEMPEAPPITAGVPEVPGGIPCGRPGLSPCGTIQGGIPGLPPGIATAPPPIPPPAPAKRKEEDHPAVPERITVGGQVQEAKVLRKVAPNYPELLKRGGVQGHVLLRAVISKEGKIQQLTVIGGNPLLGAAAMDAIKQWVYRPTTLNGVPVEVETQIDVNFTLSRQ